MTSDPIYDQIPRKYRINHHFFAANNESEEQFYWAGYIASSATVTNINRAYRVEFNLSTREVEHLTNLLVSLQTDVPIRTVSVKLKDRPYTQIRTVINSKYIVEDLQRFNILPRNKQNFFLPQYLLTHRYVKHFFRGWVDGLGTFDNDGFKTSGTLKFLQQFKEFLDNTLKTNDGQIVPPKRSRGGLFYGPKEASVIHHYLYDNAVFYLDRKKNINEFR